MFPHQVYSLTFCTFYFSFLFAASGCQTEFNQTAYKAAKTTITCDHTGNKYKSRFFCRENGSVCEDVVSTNSPLKSDGRFTLTNTSSSFSVSISDVSSRDAGVYWCGGESQDGSCQVKFRKIHLKVEGEKV